MSLKIDFANPLAISQGKEKDLIRIRVEDLEAFKSLENDNSLLQENSLI